MPERADLIGPQEGLHQRDLLELPVCVDIADRLVEHRMAEAIDRLGELHRDRGVDVGIVAVEAVLVVGPLVIVAKPAGHGGRRTR